MSNVYRLDEFRKTRRIITVPVAANEYETMDYIQLLAVSTHASAVMSSRPITRLEAEEGLRIFKAALRRAETPEFRTLCGLRIGHLMSLLNPPVDPGPASA